MNILYINLIKCQLRRKLSKQLYNLKQVCVGCERNTYHSTFREYSVKFQNKIGKETKKKMLKNLKVRAKCTKGFPNNWSVLWHFYLFYTTNVNNTATIFWLLAAICGALLCLRAGKRVGRLLFTWKTFDVAVDVVFVRFLDHCYVVLLNRHCHHRR